MSGAQMISSLIFTGNQGASGEGGGAEHADQGVCCAALSQMRPRPCPVMEEPPFQNIMHSCGWRAGHEDDVKVDECDDFGRDNDHFESYVFGLNSKHFEIPGMGTHQHLK